MQVVFSEVEYKNFGKCIKMSNGTATLIITVDLGPRVIFYGLDGMENVLKEDIERDTFRNDDKLHEFFKTDENWYIYGGHRLWSSPESFPESYTPDNSPVNYEIRGNSLILMPDDRVEVGERHQIIVTLNEDSSDVVIRHAIMNIAEYDIKLAPWCLTVADKGGVEIIPQCQKDTGLLSNRRCVFWPYSDVKDDRFYMSNEYITLSQKEDKKAFKIGINNEAGWSAYLNKGQIFIKKFDFDENACYPDYNVNYETYTNQFIMEIETLGSLETLKPGEFTEHDEYWSLIKCSETFDRKNDESIDAFVKKYIK